MANNKTAMGKATYYFSHDFNARNDEKIVSVRLKHGMEGYGVYFAILERLGESSQHIHVKDYNVISFDLRVGNSLVKSIIEDFGLFEFTEDGKHFYSVSFNERMKPVDNMREKRSVASLSKWKNSDQDNRMKRSERLSEARKKGTHTSGEWEEMKNFFGCCVKCGGKDSKIVKDHIIPIYQGGSDSITNLQPLCQHCNNSKGSDNKDYRIDKCLQNASKMPPKWLKNASKTPPKWIEMPPIKEKESKEEEKEPPTPFETNFNFDFCDEKWQKLILRWIEWCATREKRMNQYQVEAIHRTLEGFGFEEATQIVEASILNGWITLYPDRFAEEKAKQQNKQQNKQQQGKKYENLCK